MTGRTNRTENMKKNRAALICLVLIMVGLISCNLPFFGTAREPQIYTLQPSMPVFPSASPLFTLPSASKTIFPSSSPTALKSIEPAKTDSPPKTLTPMTPNITDTSFRDPNGFYSLTYPKDWITRKTTSQQQFCPASSESCFAVSIRIKALDPESQLDQVTKNLKDTLESFQENGRQESNIDGFPALRAGISYRWKGSVWKGFVEIAIRNRIGYTLIATAPENEYPALSPIHEELRNSFRILEYKEAPIYDDWYVYETDHLWVIYPENSWIENEIEWIGADHENAYLRIVDSLQVNFDQLIYIFLYPSDAALYRSTARESGFAINEGNEVHSLWISEDDHQTLGHEMAHVISYWTLGEPTQALSGEGLAVSLDQSGKDFRSLGKDLVNKGKWIPLSNMLGDEWFSRDPSVAYVESGVFVYYLVEKYGITKFQQLYPASDFPGSLKKIYGMDLASLEKDLLNWVK